MSVEKLDIGGTLVIETYKWENSKPMVSFDYEDTHSYGGSVPCSIEINKEKAVEIIEFLKKSFDIT